VRVLVACEYSGRVRQAFRAMGHHAYSCDVLPAEDGSTFHIQRDVREILSGWAPLEHWQTEHDRTPWDLMVAHPPCTDLAVSGSRWFPAKVADGRQQAAIDFFMALASAPIERIAIENPVSIMSTRWRKPDQIIQPWQFGHGETKATCLWLKGLPKLTPTNIVAGREARVHRMSPAPDRWKDRSRTYQGIADAMAAQWG
jgi:site-specific DNA-cytosine methylase